MHEFGEIYKGIEISTTSSSDFSNFSQSFCFGFLPTAAYGPPLGFPHLYDVFHRTEFGRARKRAKSANALVFLKSNSCSINPADLKYFYNDFLLCADRGFRPGGDYPPAQGDPRVQGEES